MALPVVIAGVLCVLDGSSTSLVPPLPTHSLFAALLCGWIVAEWYTLARNSDGAVGDDWDVTRDLIHRMYLILYVIVGVSQLVGLISLRYFWVSRSLG
jgi:hypothetical protein